MDAKEVEKIGRLAVAQLKVIQARGCGEFKCKNCYINHICDHYAIHAKDYATQILVYASSHVEQKH